jgi:hypothetical protein
MARPHATPLSWTRNRGRNGWDSIFDVPLDQSVETQDLHLNDGGIGTRRGGSVSVTITGVTAPVCALGEFIPGQDLTAAELYLVDSATPPNLFRCAAGAAFTALTMTDAISNPTQVSFATLNGKFYIAYDSPVNRLHLYEPAFSATTPRKAGLPAPAAPTVTNTGAGAYAATARYYATALLEVRTGITVRRSNQSASTSFTPSGAGAAARIASPTTASEGDTHYAVLGSIDGILFYDLGTQALGSTYDDSVNPSAYANGTASPVSGSLTPFPSVKWLATDGSHLIGFGVFESAAGDSVTPRNGRVYISPALGSTSDAFMDEEQIVNSATTNAWVDLSRNSSAVDRGITPKPVNGNLFAFQSNGVYGLVPTESGLRPYRRVLLDPQIGNIDARAIVNAVDRFGRPCSYFLDPVRGPYCVGGADGLRWVGKDVFDVWQTVNRDATTVTAWGMWFPDLHQVIFAISRSANNTPDAMIVLDVTEMHQDEEGDLRGGWVKYLGGFAQSYCGVLFSNTLSATRSVTRVPYVGKTNKLLRYDSTATDDGGEAINPTVTSGVRAIAPALGVRTLQVLRSYIIGQQTNPAGSQIVVVQQLTRNAGDETPRQSTVSLTPSGSETYVLRQFEDAALQDAWCFQVTLSCGITGNFKLAQWYGQVTEEAPL